MYDRARQPTLRRNPHSWFALRLFLGVLGAALVLLPLALPESWIASIFGLVLFLTSILLPSPREREQVPESAALSSEELVLTGAEYSDGSTAPIPVKLLVSQKQVLAVKPDSQPAVAVPSPELVSVFLQRSDQSWLLVLETSTRETVFSFHGIAALRHALRAESAIRRFATVVPLEKAKARAAGA